MGSIRYFIGFLVTVGLIILLIVLLFHHGGSKVPVTKTPLTSYANTDTVVRETIDGPINAPQNHRQLQITVGRDNTTFEEIGGYDGNVIKTQTYGMTQNAYANFLFALNRAGYTQGNTDSALKDERGYCPEGRRYIFEVIQGGNDLERYWVTTCSGTPKTFNGKSSLIIDLFRAQVPDYTNLTSDLNNGTASF